MGRFGRCLAVLLAAAFTIAPVAPALAGDSVVTAAELERAVAARHDADEASRAALRSLLARDEVKAVANSAGVDLQQARSAIATLDSAELRTLAAQAAAADQALAGGDMTIQISVVTLLLIIIIIILLAD
jgi:hypothetical protein